MNSRVAAGRRAQLLDLRPPPASLCGDVRRGLASAPRKLPPKYFYDDAGALLFERITQLDEYYPTRTEIRILERHSPELASLIGPRARLVEFGSGSGAKTRIVLEQLEQATSYVPIDISRRQLLAFADSFSRDFPELHVQPVCADYSRAVRLPADPGEPRRTVAFFPGSTIGNFEVPEAEAFLRQVAALCGVGGRLLIGTDLHKDRAVLERAYNDESGVTAAFNLNLLARINRECGADFDLDGFRHQAFYDELQQRIEMRLVAARAQAVSLPVRGGFRSARRGSDFAPQRSRPEAARPDRRAPARFHFQAGDYITTEYSHKYTTAGFTALAARAGWRVIRAWADERCWFAVWLLGIA